MKALLALFGALLLSTAVLNIANGSMFTLIALRLTQQVQPAWIGLIASGHFVGLLVGSLTATAIIGRVGHIRAFTVFAAVASCGVLLLGLLPSRASAPLAGVIGGWIVLRILIGYCMAGLFMTLESWFNANAANEQRGRIFAAYMVASSGAFAIGPFLVTLGNPDAYPLFAMTAILFNLCLLPIALTRGGNPVIAIGDRLGIRTLFRISPLGVVGCVTSGLVNSAIYGMGAAYGELVGLSDGGVSLMFSAIITGGLAMQFPVGWLSDRVDRRTMLLAMTGLATLAAVVVMVFGARSLAALACLGFVFGGLSSPIYGLSVAQTNDYVSKEQFVAVSSGLLIAYSIGAIAGPNLASWIMNGVGPGGLWLYAAAALFVLAGFTLYRMRRRAPLPVPEQGHYVPAAGETPVANALDPRADQGTAQDLGPADPSPARHSP